MTGIRCGVVCAGLMLVTFASNDVFAGVRGSRFQGFDVINNGEEVVGQTHDFRNDGTYLLVENQSSGTYNFPGTYSETDLGLFSIWNAVVSDGSPDSEAQVNGFSLFGFLTTVTVTNSDVNIVAKGFSFKVGAAQRAMSTDSDNIGVAGGSGK